MLCGLLSRTRPCRVRRNRLWAEALEPRYMLSGAPTVADVNVSSTDWSAGFVDYLETSSLGTDGYSIPVGSSDQLDPLPWNNLDQVRITFSEDVRVQASDLSVSGVNTTAYAFSDFSYDSQTYTAVWTLANQLTEDKLLIDLDGDGLDPVEDLADNTLDGEWTNSSSTYNSGNGVAGGDFEFRLDVLPGDVNQTGVVTNADYLYTRVLNGKDTEDAGYLPLRDIDGSGQINSTDYDAIYAMIGDDLPTGDPAGVSDDAPTTQGFSDVNVNEDAADQVISLFNAFDDAEDSDSQMTYAIISNRNPNLFDSTDIDGVQGELTLDLAEDAFGIAELVIRATDTAGLIVDTLLLLQLSAVNDAPVISDFSCTVDAGSIWTFTGTVTDVDDDPTGWTVTFGGVLSGHTTSVQSDGTFEYAVYLAPETFGNALAQTEDDDEAESNVASCYVGVT